MTPRFTRKAIVLCAAACFLSHCRKAEETTAQGALAVVAGRAVTEQDLLKEAEWRKANHQEVPAAPQLLKELVERLALVEKAKRTGLADDPDTLRRIQSLLIVRLREKELETQLSKVSVSDEDLARAYEARRVEFARKGLDRFSILFQAVDSKASDQRRAEARKRLEEGVALADANPSPGGRGPAASGFGSTAIQYSEDQASRYRGGDIGWVESDAKDTRWPSNLLEAGRALEKGRRSGIIETPEGFYVVMKTDSRPGGERPLEEVAEGLRQQLLRDRKLAIEEAFVADALKLSNAEIHAGAADKVKLPVPSTTKSGSEPTLSPP